MDAKTFFTYFMRLFVSNPPASADAYIITDLAYLGLVPGPDFDFDALDPAVKDDSPDRSGRPRRESGLPWLTRLMRISLQST